MLLLSSKNTNIFSILIRSGLLSTLVGEKSVTQRWEVKNYFSFTFMGRI